MHGKRNVPVCESIELPSGIPICRGLSPGGMPNRVSDAQGFLLYAKLIRTRECPVCLIAAAQ